jgi:hypothetical protein
VPPEGKNVDLDPDPNKKIKNKIKNRATCKLMKIWALFISGLDNLFTKAVVNVHARNKLYVKAKCIE